MQFLPLRITIRSMMIAVALLGVAAWLATGAVLIARDPTVFTMSHFRVRVDTGQTIRYIHPITGVFWPRYWRRLAGRPWPGNYFCPPSCRENHAAH